MTSPDRSYEDSLGDSLQLLLASGADDLQALADGLNARGPGSPTGAAWTAASLEQELHRLATDSAEETKSHRAE